jgi:cyclophilin family peptidyl-prolyl cis-trans isomerase
VLAQIQSEYPEDVRIVYRHFPLNSIHDKAALSGQASEAAGLQGKFWELHDLLFERQQEWTGMAVPAFEAWLVERATELGMDAEQFKTDLVSQAVVDKVAQGWQFGQDVGLPGTPFLLFNGNPAQVQLSEAAIKEMVESILLEKRAYTSCPPMVIDPAKKYTATLATDQGDIVVELFADKAPLAVNSFVFLAREGWFDDVTFHRVLPGFVAQAGDPSGSGMGGPGYQFANETSDLKFDAPGILGMANSGADTNGSQFFITYAPAANLDGGYTIFGRVIEGMGNAEKLTPRDPSQNPNLPPGDRILGVTIEEQ